MTTTALKRTLRASLLPAALLALVGLLVVGARTAAAAGTKLEPTPGCDLAVINDWADNNKVDKLYAIPCYEKAIQRLNTYPDLKGYSSAADDIHQAELRAIRLESRNQTGTGQGKTTTTPGVVAPGGSNSSGGGPTGSNPGGGGPTPGGSSSGGSSSGAATSVPLPLIVLGALAVLLLLAAGGTWLARRIQTRRMSPAPAPARRR